MLEDINSLITLFDAQNSALKQNKKQLLEHLQNLNYTTAYTGELSAIKQHSVVNYSEIIKLMNLLKDKK